MVRLAKVSRRVPVSQASSASVRADVLQNYFELFGTKTIDGRKVNVEELVAQLTRDTRDEFAALMKARHELHGLVASRQFQYDFLDLVASVQRAGDGPAKETARRALRAHDYVYDVFESVEGVAA
jgi:hypothetical protein